MADTRQGLAGATVSSCGFPGPPGWKSLTRAMSRVLGTIPPTGLLLLAIISVQLGAVLAIHLFSTLGPNGTVFLRVAFGAVLVAIAAPPVFDATLRRNARLVVLFGCVIAVQTLCFFHAIARIPLGTAVTIEFLGPLGVAVFSSRRPVDFLWIALAGLGLALLTPDIGSGLDPWGVLFAAITGGAWAAFIILSVRVGRVFPGGSGLSPAMIVAALVLAPFAVFSADILQVAPTVLLVVLGVAVLSTTIPTVLEFEALKTMPLRKHGIILAIEPVVAMIVGAVLLSETIEAHGLLAAAAVMFAAIGATFTGRKRS
ncbi:MAG: EamA family transporter [Pseudomonadota bacterium]